MALSFQFSLVNGLDSGALNVLFNIYIIDFAYANLQTTIRVQFL